MEHKLTYNLKSPHPALRRWVSHYFLLEGEFDPADPSASQTLFPGLNAAFIVQQTGALDVVVDGHRRVRPRGFAEGHFHRPFHLRSSRPFRLLGIEFHPGQVHHYLRATQGEINDEFVDLEDIFGPQMREWLERLSSETQFGGAARLFDQFLVKRQPVLGRDDLILEHVIRLVYDSRGNAPVAQLAQAVGVSKRQIERLFRDSLGLTPKYFSRAVRFNAFLKLCYTGPGERLTNLAQSCGYFDQAHLIHEFRRFTDLTPSEFLNGDHCLEETMVRVQEGAGDREQPAPTQRHGQGQV